MGGSPPPPAAFCRAEGRPNEGRRHALPCRRGLPRERRPGGPLGGCRLADRRPSGPWTHLHRYGLFGGTTVGFGGLEPYGTDVLLRSLCVMPIFHRRGIGRNITLLLMTRALDLGARQAYALPSTQESSAFFQSLGFAPIPRPAAPPAILATRQASGLCPASTPLLTRRIAL
ncbi:GNAT family N-acetyltransferase [Hyphomicrobiales bacterium BP6-180914]|uniref:GNAT family N-acetyltransferase n=1 Tax=Lichenifustis flavocetrariae TaxID=2949735 RepID=A0AA42CQX4_9HYPH|nr:GNAT family N-acetyltransferase [Lichenifustis flavocetrariae]MCW6511882.1 GNAT family N-acetyltransferase [Lichenifustis flavocetrariae]